MSLDETSLIIGKLQADVANVKDQMANLQSSMSSIDGKLDRALNRQSKFRLTIKHWIAILVSSSAGAGGIAHALHRIFD